MANILRPPLIFRTWHKQPWMVAAGSQEWVWQDPMNLRLVKQDRIFGGPGQTHPYDYPNPTLPKDRRVAANTTYEQQSDRLNNLLIKQDIIWGPRGMVPDYDWPNPVRQKDSRVAASSEDWVWQERNNNLLVKQDIIFGARGMVPDYDWPNPNHLKNERGVSAEAQSGVLQNWLLGTLRGQDQIYGGPGEVPDYDWTNPVWPKEWRGTAIRAEDGVLQNWLLGTLQGQDRIYGGPGAVPDYDWPNPTWPKNRYVAIAAQALVAFNVALFAPGPLVQRDWPNPVLPISRQVALRAQVEVSQNELSFNLLGQDVIWRSPGEVPTYDWTNLTLPLSRTQAVRAQSEVFPDNWIARFFNSSTNRYWVGGTDMWLGVAGVRWSPVSGGPGGASPPDQNNDVFFDANSGSVTITLGSNPNIRNFICSGFTGTYAGSGGPTVTGPTCIFPNTMSYTNNGTLFFEGLSTNFTSGGNTIGSIGIGPVGGSVIQLQDNLSVAGAITLNSATFDTNGKDVTTGSFVSSNAVARSIIFGGNFTLTGTGTIWNTATHFLLTTNTTSGTVRVTNNSSANKTINGGGITFPNLWNDVAGTGSLTILGANTFKDFKQSAGVTTKLPHGVTTTITSWTDPGSFSAGITLDSDNGSTKATISMASGVVNAMGCTIKNSNAAGGATFNALIAYGNADGGDNAGWFFGYGQAGLQVPNWPNPTRAAQRISLNGQDSVSAGLALSQGSVAVPFFQIAWPNPPNRALWHVSLNTQRTYPGGVPPSPPVVTDIPWSGMIVNPGHMMGRRG